MRVLGDRRGVVVADFGSERRHQHQRAFDQLGDAGAIRLGAGDAAVGKAARGVGEQTDRLEHGGGDHGLEHVQLEVALQPADRHGDVVAHHTRGDHGQRLGLRRIDLAGHDRAARLVLGQAELTEPRARAAAEQAEVVGDLGQADGEHVERARQLDHRVVACQRLELVRRGDEGEAGQRRQLGGDILREAGARIQPGADGGPSLRQLIEAWQHRPDPRDAGLDLRGIARHLLAQADRSGVLQMGAPDLDDVVPLFGFVLQTVVEVSQGGQQPRGDLARRRDVHRGRKRVVRRRAGIDMVVGVDRHLAAPRACQQLVGAPGDDLVGVHVRLGARPRLPDNQRKLLIPLAARDLGRRLLDAGCQVVVEHTEPGVDPRRRLLDQPERMDERQRHPLARLRPRRGGIDADREVADRSLRLRTPVDRSVDVEGTEAVGFGTGGHAFHLSTALSCPAERGSRITTVRDHGPPLSRQRRVRSRAAATSSGNGRA